MKSIMCSKDTQDYVRIRKGSEEKEEGRKRRGLLYHFDRMPWGVTV
jgi:hypothetical protein